MSTKTYARTIADLRDALADYDQDTEVFIDNVHPTALSSWRGDYSDLAIERQEATTYDKTSLKKRPEPYGSYHPGSSGVQIKQPATVGELRRALDLAVGAVLEGYKGGQYEMRDDTDIWVSNYGDAESLRVQSIEDLGDRVDLRTADVDDMS